MPKKIARAPHAALVRHDTRGHNPLAIPLSFFFFTLSFYDMIVTSDNSARSIMSLPAYISCMSFSIFVSFHPK